MRSMTGFAEFSSDDELYSVSVSIKGLNSKHLDINVRLPGFAYFLEYDIRDMVKQYISRGRVDVYVNIRFISDAAFSVHWDTIHSYMKTVEEILAMHPTLQGIISFDDIYKTSNFWDVADKEKLREITLNVVEVALKKFVEVKIEEGRHIEEIIKNHLKIVEENLKAVDSLLPDIYNDIRKRVLEILNSTSVESTSLKECVHVVNSLLVDEEIKRAFIHVDRLFNILDKDRGIGYTLNILLQELQREINTLSQKIRHHKVADKIVEMRSRIEAMKEHAMNVE